MIGWRGAVTDVTELPCITIWIPRHGKHVPTEGFVVRRAANHSPEIDFRRVKETDYCPQMARSACCRLREHTKESTCCYRLHSV